MSTVAFGALSTRREQSDSGKSTSEQPPGLSFYVDILVGLVPAEVLAINSIVVASVTTHAPLGPVTAAAATATYRWMFWLLLGLAAVLFVLGRRPAPAPGPAAGAGGPAGSPAAAQQNGDNQPSWQNWEWQDLIRTLIAPAAYVCWTMVQPTGVWSAIVPSMSSGTRLLIPLVGAAVLGAITKATASHADKKPSPAERRAAAGRKPALNPAPTPGPAPAPGPALNPAPTPGPAPAPHPTPGPAPAADPAPHPTPGPEPAADLAPDPAPRPAPEDEPGEQAAPAVPSWVY
jgi:hypothetical protein